MDLKSFYKKIDVDNIKSKLPPIPQIKIPKIKSRKIFKSSREDLSQQQPTAGAFAGPPMTPQSLPPPSAFIDRTPTRISTVSSLMNINEEGGYASKNQFAMSTYRTASTFEVENCPDAAENGDTTSGSAASKFSDKFKKTYKDISEFKIKDFFGKKTVVKKTEIEVDIYARQYERERREEEELEDMEADSGYEFQIKESRRHLSKSTDSISPPDSLASGVPSPIRSELSHLQKSITPPLLGRRRNAIDEPGPSRLHHLQRSMSEDSGHEPPRKPNRSSLWGIAEKNSNEDGPTSQLASYKAGISKLSGFRKSRKDTTPSDDQPSTSDSVWKLKSLRARFASEDSGSEQKPRKSMQSHDSTDDQSETEKTEKPEKKGWKMSNLSLKQSDPLDNRSESHTSSPEGKFSTIKQSIKRLKQRKSRSQASDESETEHNNEEVTKPNVSDQLRAGLRRLRLKERSLTFDEGETKDPPNATQATGHTTTQTATERLRNWKKSFKVARTHESVADDDEAPSRPPPPPPGRSATLLRKLNHIRSRKAASENGTDDESGDPKRSTDTQSKPKTTNMEKLEHARDKAMKKVNEQMQKMKKLHASKSRDSPAESSPEKPPRSRRIEIEDQSEGVIAELPRSAPTIWTTSKAISQSFESDDFDLPRVLIHQDNSDQYESTLIIAVTRPAPPIPTAVINEIIPKSKQKLSSDWIPNKGAISSFLEMTPSPPSTSKQIDVARGHIRKRSMDSNDSDSWIPDNYRNKNCTSSTSAGLNKIKETSEPWRVHGTGKDEKLYKTRSIDIFTNRDEGAFADFDDEMKNVPVRRIGAVSAESIEHSTDDDDDYDTASRITRVKRPSPLIITRPQSISATRSESMKRSTDSTPEIDLAPKKGRIGNSQESLDANYDENETFSSDDDDDDDNDNDDDEELPPALTPSPPPSYSPPPPPLPLRKPPRHIPDRNDSMVRLAKPLVKQASLRRHYSEEIEPSDLGKVNKLISRFEKNPSEENVSIMETVPAENERNVEEKWTNKTKEDTTRHGSKKRVAPVPRKSEDIPEIQESVTDNSKSNDATPTHNDNNNNNNRGHTIGATVHSQPSKDTPTLDILDNVSIQSPNSEYGSPIGSMCLSERTISEYGSPIGTAYTTKSIDQFRTARRLSNRSSLRDDETYYSFESDEESNFYSLGDSSSTKYTIEI